MLASLRAKREEREGKGVVVGGSELGEHSSFSLWDFFILFIS